MKAFQRSLPLLFGLGLILTQGRQVSHAQGPPERPRAFYLTQTTHSGGEARSACAAGYHMASLWEIFDTSNLRYDTRLGLTQGDSGSGPPTFVYGWIRTGNIASTGLEGPGAANCSAWTSDSGMDSGTVVLLEPDWSAGGTEASPVSPISPWAAAAGGCVTARNVWCVQN